MKTISQSQFAKRIGQSRQFVHHLIEQRIITVRPDKRLDYADALAKATAYAKARQEAVALHSGKTALAAKKLSLQCDLLAAQLRRELGEVHSRQECAQSLVEGASVAFHSLMPLHSRIKGKFPELSQAVIDGIAAEVDSTIEMVRSTIPTNPRFQCPHCHQHIETLEPMEATK